MIRLIGYEWKKILMKKVNVAVLAAGVFLMIAYVSYSIYDNSVISTDTKEYVTGVKSFVLSKEQNQELTESLTEDFLSKEVGRIQSYGVDLGSDQAYYDYLRQNFDFWNLIAGNYTEMNEYVEMEILNDIGDNNGIHFYEARKEKIESYLNWDFTYGNYTQAEKDFWMKKVEEADVPFAWGSKDNMRIIWNGILFSIYAVFILILCVATVFSSEVESGAAALLLTTKKGRKTHAGAKIIASVLFAVFYQCVLFGIAICIEGILIGFDGAKLPIQLWGTEIPYNWSVGKAYTINFFVILLVTVAMVLFTLLLSSRVRNSIVTLVISLIVMIVPLMLPMSKTSGLWNHINYLFPIRVVILKDCLKTFNSYVFGNMVISYIGMIFIVYAMVSLFCLCFISGGYTKYQVQ